MKRKKCFVISPIGEKDSDIRRHADSFLKLLVEQSLSEFNFDIIRADQIATSSIITNDIVEYVQQSELCLVDLTFHNPNVFYECGRRHENGKATIQLIKKGEKLPFDVAGIRTIEYDLTDPWTTLESVKILKDFIHNLESNDAFGDRHTGVSLTSIAQSLNRIEKKISDTYNNQSQEGVISKYDLLIAHPATAFQNAFSRGDFDSAKFLLSRLKALPNKKTYIKALNLLATSGDLEAKTKLLETGMNESGLTGEDYIEIVSGLKNHYYNTDSERFGYEETQNLIQHIKALQEKFNDQENGAIMNSIQTIAYNAENFNDALIFGLKASEYVADSGSIWYNLALCYLKLERFNDAANTILKFVKYEKDFEEYHIQIVKEIFEKSGRSNELDKVLKQISK